MLEELFNVEMNANQPLLTKEVAKKMKESVALLHLTQGWHLSSTYGNQHIRWLERSIASASCTCWSSAMDWKQKWYLFICPTAWNRYLIDLQVLATGAKNVLLSRLVNKFVYIWHSHSVILQPRAEPLSTNGPSQVVSFLTGAPNDRFLRNDLKCLVMHPGVL